MKENFRQCTENFLMRRWVSQLPILILVAIAISVSTYLQISQMTRIEARNQQTRIKQAYQLEEQQTKESLRLLSRLPILNFENLVADWTFLNFLQYFGDDEARKKTGYSASTDFFEIIIKKDPCFLDIYPYLSSSITLYAGQPQQTVTLLEHGVKKIPFSKQAQAYFLWQAKGTDELLFLGKNQAAQHSYEMAAAWAEKSTDPTLQSIAARSRQTSQYLASNPNSRRARVGAWFNILTNAVDESASQLALQQIKILGGHVSISSKGSFQVTLPKKD
jgi:hypothetical protein